MASSLTIAVSAFLTALVQRFTALPTTQGLMTSGSGNPGLEFIEGAPYTELNIATTDPEFTTMQSQTTVFLDARSMRLHTKTNGAWSDAGYLGGHPLLRPETLCQSPLTARTYYCDRFIRLTEVYTSPS